MNGRVSELERELLKVKEEHKQCEEKVNEKEQIIFQLKNEKIEQRQTISRLQIDISTAEQKYELEKSKLAMQHQQQIHELEHNLNKQQLQTEKIQDKYNLAESESAKMKLVIDRAVDRLRELISD